MRIPLTHSRMEAIMKLDKLLSALFAIAGIALVSMLTDDMLVSKVHAEDHLLPSQNHGQAERTLLADNDAPISRPSVQPHESRATREFHHMQQLMMHLDELEARGLADPNIERIQRAILHRLSQLQAKHFPSASPGRLRRDEPAGHA